MDRNIKDLWEGFAEAVLFTSYDENDEPLDYTIYDFDDESESRTKKLLENYYSKYKEEIEESELPLNTIGNDIWYARSGQGAGFFDHSLDSDIEEKLTKGATDMGEYASAFEQDGKVYIEDGRKMSFGGGVAVGGIVGAYLGYKAGRMRPQKAGFETEKKIGRRIKKEGQKIAGDITISKKKPQTMAKGGNIKPKYKLGDSVIVDYGNNTKGEITIKDSFNPNWSNGFVYTSYEKGDSMIFTEDMISERDGFNEVWGRFKDGIRKDFGGDKYAEGGTIGTWADSIPKRDLDSMVLYLFDYDRDIGWDNINDKDKKVVYDWYKGADFTKKFTSKRSGGYYSKDKQLVVTRNYKDGNGFFEHEYFVELYPKSHFTKRQLEKLVKNNKWKGVITTKDPQAIGYSSDLKFEFEIDDNGLSPYYRGDKYLSSSTLKALLRKEVKMVDDIFDNRNINKINQYSEDFGEELAKEQKPKVRKKLKSILNEYGGFPNSMSDKRDSVSSFSKGFSDELEKGYYAEGGGINPNDTWEVEGKIVFVYDERDKNDDDYYDYYIDDYKRRYPMSKFKTENDVIKEHIRIFKENFPDRYVIEDETRDKLYISKFNLRNETDLEDRIRTRESIAYADNERDWGHYVSEAERSGNYAEGGNISYDLSDVI